MKVLRKGNAALLGWKREFKCNGHDLGGGGCGAFLLVEFGDLYKLYKPDETNTLICFMCPECGTETSPNWMDLGKIRWYQNDIPNRPQHLTELKEKLIKGTKKPEPEKEPVKEPEKKETRSSIYDPYPTEDSIVGSGRWED